MDSNIYKRLSEVLTQMTAEQALRYILQTLSEEQADYLIAHLEDICFDD